MLNKTDKIFSYLPDWYQDIGKESIIYSLMDIFGKRLQAIEDDTFEVMRSHWVNYADRDKKEIDDLNRLGSLFDIKPIEGESVKEYRRRLKKMIRIYIDGVGTIRAIVEVVAAVFGWDVCPRIILPNNKGVDEFATIARIVDFGKQAGCKTSDDCRIDDVIIKECPFKKIFNLEIIDNPEKSAFREVKQDEVNNQHWEVTNYGIYKATPSITIKASGEEIKNPVVVNKTTGQTLVYIGTIKQGSILNIIPHKKAVLDDQDVADKIFYFTGDRFGEGRFNLSVFERGEKGLFGPELPSGKFRKTKFDESLFDPIEQRLSSPELPPGKTEWAATVLQAETSIYAFLEERFEESLFEEAVFDHSGFDVITLDLQENKEIHGEIRLDWVERQTATFMVRLPMNLRDLLAQKQPSSSLQVNNLRELLEKEIVKIKAAGVEAIIEYRLDPFKETHEQTAKLLSIEDLIPQVEKHESGESLKIALECEMEESHPIIDRFAVTSEIKATELQSQEDKFGIRVDCKYTQLHEQLEKLSLQIEAKAEEKHLMEDTLFIQGIFNGTYFDASCF